MFRIDGANLSEVDPQNVKYSGRQQMPDIGVEELSAGHVPPHIMPHLMSSDAHGERLVYTAYRLRRDDPQAYGLIEPHISAGNANRARLMLLVAEKHPQELELAALALEDSEVIESRVGELAAKLSHGVVGDIAKEIDGLLPRHEVKLPAPPPKPTHQVRVTVKPKIKEPEPKPPEAPVKSPAQVVSDYVTEQVFETFPDEQFNPASEAYDAFKRAGNSFTLAHWQAVFSAAKKLSRFDRPNEKLDYFTHVLRNPADVELFSEPARVSSAENAISHILFMVSPPTTPAQRERAFRDIFLTSPQDFRIITGEQSEQLSSTISCASDHVDERLRFTEHVFSQSDPERRTLEFIMRENVVVRGGKIVSAISRFAARHIEGSDQQQIRARAFESVLLQDAETLAHTTSERAYEALGRVGAENMHSRFGPCAGQFVQLLVSRPQVLENLLSDDGQTLSNAFVNFVDAALKLPNGRGYVDRVFESMQSNPSYASELSRPDVLENTIGLLSRCGGSVSPRMILEPDFMCRPQAEQERKLEVVKSLMDDPYLLIPSNNHPPGEGDVQNHGGGTPRPERQHIEHLLSVHGFRVPNPAYVQGIEYPGDVRGLFFMLNRTFLRTHGIQRIETLPYHQQQIVTALSNSVEQEFTMDVERLQQALEKHPLIGRVYQASQTHLLDDLRALEQDRVLVFTDDHSGVRLREEIINVADQPRLEPGSDAERQLLAVITSDSTNVQLDRKILEAVGRSENYLASVDGITASCGDSQPKSVKARIAYLVDHGILLNPAPLTNLRILSPDLISQIPGMVIPRLYTQEYPHVIDPVKRVTGMYQPLFSSDTPAHAQFSAKVEKRAYAIDHATELMSVGDRKRVSDASEVTIERRQAIVRALSNLNLDINHGAKLEQIKKAAEDAGISVKDVEPALSSLVDAGLVERISLGYYRIRQEFWVKKPARFGEIEYPTNQDSSQMSSNIMEAELTSEVAARIGNAAHGRKALAVLRLMSNLHINVPYCARAIDLRDLMQTAGFRISESQVRGDMDTLTAGVKPYIKFGAVVGTGGKRIEHEEGFFYPPLIEKVAPSTSEVYWRFMVPQANMTGAQASEIIPKDARVFSGTGRHVTVDALATELSGLDNSRHVDFVDVSITRVDPENIALLDNPRKYRYFIKERGGGVKGVVIWVGSNRNV